MRPTFLAVHLAVVVAIAGASTGAAASHPTATDPPGSTTSPSASTNLLGVDVSHWNGAIDWGAVYAAGRRFAVVKATEGRTYVDPTVVANKAGAAAAGLAVTAYHFATPATSLGDARAQADHFVDAAMLRPGNLVPALDLETAGDLAPAALTTWVFDWLDRVTTRTSVEPMIYTSPSFWKNKMLDTRAFADAGFKVLWVAHWGVGAPTVPAQNWGGHGWTFWQFSDCGSVPGIPGCVDEDQYNGTDLGPVTLGAGPVALAGNATWTKTDSVAFNVPAQGTPGLGVSNDGRTWLEQPNATALAWDLTDAAAGGTDRDGSKRAWVRWQDANGGWTTAQSDAIVLDRAPPVVSVPIASMPVPSSALSSGIPMRVAWTGSDTVTGVARYELDQSTDGAGFVRLNSYLTTTSFTRSLLPSHTYAFRVRAFDQVGNVSAWFTGALFSPGVLQESSSSISYIGSWHPLDSTSAYGGHLRATTSTGARGTLRFTGRGIGWVSAFGPSRGSAAVYLDGVLYRTVSLYRSSNLGHQIVFARLWSVSGTHTISIVDLGTSGHPRVDVDALIVLR